MDQTNQCPCGSDLPFEMCCKPLLGGERNAQTAEALMRSRYTAYTRAQVDYILATTHPERRGEYAETSIREWAENATWHSLEIQETVQGGPEDDCGEVEFVAYYTQDGIENRHHEKSEFRKKDDVWYFWDGKSVKPQPLKRKTAKIGRNAPCPCGSGRKYKKCCGK